MSKTKARHHKPKSLLAVTVGSAGIIVITNAGCYVIGNPYFPDCSTDPTSSYCTELDGGHDGGASDGGSTDGGSTDGGDGG